MVRCAYKRPAVSFHRWKLEIVNKISAVINHTCDGISKQPNFIRTMKASHEILLCCCCWGLCIGSITVFSLWDTAYTIRAICNGIYTKTAKLETMRLHTKWKTITVPIRRELKLKQLTKWNYFDFSSMHFVLFRLLKWQWRNCTFQISCMQIENGRSLQILAALRCLHPSVAVFVSSSRQFVIMSLRISKKN